MTGKTMGWLLGIGLAVSGTLLTASPAMADRDKDESGQRREYRDRDYGHGRGRDHGRKHDRDDDRVSVKIGIGHSSGGHGHSGYHAPSRRWVEGHYVRREERVLVEPGHYEERRIPAVYETRYDHCGRPYRVMVCPERCERAWCPPRYETRCVKVWVPGCWADGPVAYHPAPRRDSGFFFGFKGTFRD
jgi:Ni/Co efflux regulator RcnB